MFNTSIAGINGAQKYLDTTSNNLANANSYGFKKSRAEFADVYTNTIFSNSKTATGMGVVTSTVAQQFSQGSLSGDTGNNLDMAIKGDGFFVLSNEPNDTAQVETGAKTYTRNGAFELDSNGYLITAMGDYVQGYDIDEGGNVTNLDIQSTHAIQIPSDTGAPKASTKLGLTANLPANADNLATVDDNGNITSPSYNSFDPTDSSTYTNATSQTIYDSLGGAHSLTYYFMKDSVDSDSGQTTWYVLTYVDGTEVDIANGESMTINNSSSIDSGTTYSGMKLVFGTDGKLIDGGQTPTQAYLVNKSSNHTSTTNTLVNAMGGGVDDSQDVLLDLDYTQYGSSKFTVGSITNNGYSTGLLQDVEVNDDGLIMATYTNGQTKYITKVALAKFANPQGLVKVGDTQWQQGIDSGEPVASEANEGTTGSIKGANLELSNVEMASELVDLIIAQRTYQANAQALQTQNTAMDSIMNIR